MANLQQHIDHLERGIQDFVRLLPPTAQLPTGQALLGSLQALAKAAEDGQVALANAAKEAEAMGALADGAKPGRKSSAAKAKRARRSAAAMAQGALAAPASAEA